jgi:hypothetical protein
MTVAAMEALDWLEGWFLESGAPQMVRVHLEKIDAIRAALTPVGSSHIPDGWKWVPERPTKKMLSCGYEALRKYLEALPEDEKNRRFGDNSEYGTCVFSNAEKFTARWIAMLAAAPPPPPPTESK